MENRQNCRSHSKIWLVAASVFAIGLTAPPAAHASYFEEFDAPGATATYAISINSNGNVAGFYIEPKTAHRALFTHGFFRLANGTITTVDPPSSQFTSPQAMNGNDIMVGYYSFRRRGGRFHGFLRSPGGTFTEIDVDQARDTFPAAINASGQVTGYYDLATGSNCHGFLRQTDGSVTAFDVPQAQCTIPVGINKSGTIAGSWSDGVTSHGFVRNPDGTLISFDVPAAEGTVAESLDNAGRVIGHYSTSSGLIEAFLRDSDGTITTFSVAGALQTFATDLAARKNGGAAATGYAYDVNFHATGYVRGTEGFGNTFEAPGAGGGTGQGTFATAIISDRRITGYYVDQSDITHSFIRIP